MLDEAGYPDCTICASNSLDEYIVRDLILQGARVDSFGIGENMITAKSAPVFGGVYKLAAVREDDGSYTPEDEAVRIRREDDYPLPEKGLAYLRPGRQGDGRPYHDGPTRSSRPSTASRCLTRWRPGRNAPTSTARPAACPPRFTRTASAFTAPPSLDDIKKFCKAQVNTLWDEVKRLRTPTATTLT